MKSDTLLYGQYQRIRTNLVFLYLLIQYSGSHDLFVEKLGILVRTLGGTTEDRNPEDLESYRRFKVEFERMYIIFLGIVDINTFSIWRSNFLKEFYRSYPTTEVINE